MNIVIIGHVCIDKNTSEHSTYEGAGSPAMFMNTIFSQLPDCHVTTIAPYGDDFKIYTKNIDIYPRNPSDKETLIYENITKNGKRNQKAYNRNALPIKINDDTKEILKDADIVIIAPLLSNFSGDYIETISHSLDVNTPIFLIPQGYFRGFDSENSVIPKQFDEEEKVLSHCNFMFVSQEDFPHIIHLAEDWSKKYDVVSIVTLGKDGAICFQDTKQINFETKPVDDADVIDSVGCGDIFAAAFAYRFAETKDVNESGRFANAIARQRLFFKTDEIKINYSEAIQK